MKQYVVIKNYPGLKIPLGYTVHQKLFDDYEVLINNKKFTFTRSEIEDYPEFWQKNEKLDYEILSFILPDGSIITKKGNSYSREEIVKLIKVFSEEFVANTNTAYKQKDINNWIKENL